MSEEKLFEMSLPATIEGCYAVLREMSGQEGSPISIKDVGIPKYDDDDAPSEISVSIGAMPDVWVASGSITLVKTNANRTWVRFYKTTEPDKFVQFTVMDDPEKQAQVDQAIANAQELVEAAHDAFQKRVAELKMVD